MARHIVRSKHVLPRQGAWVCPVWVQGHLDLMKGQLVTEEPGLLLWLPGFFFLLPPPPPLSFLPPPPVGETPLSVPVQDAAAAEALLGSEVVSRGRDGEEPLVIVFVGVHRVGEAWSFTVAAGRNLVLVVTIQALFLKGGVIVKCYNSSFEKQR